MPKETCYEFSFTQVNGQLLPLAKFKGMVMLVVNTASQCGFTVQYSALQHLYETYREQGLQVIAVPSNDFGGQEPGTNKDVQEFCAVNYGVGFPVVAKEVVKGPDAHPFYQWARETGGFLATPKWEFS